MGFGSFLARPFKDIHKAVKKVGGGVGKAVKGAGGAAKAAVGIRGRKSNSGSAVGSGSVGPSAQMRKKVMPERDNSV